MNDLQQNTENSSDNYWPSVLLAGGIFAIISFVLGLIFSYSQFNSDPSGTFISPIMIGNGVVCLATAFAGMLAVWHFTKEVTQSLKLGKGALIGFFSGAFVIIFSTLLNEIWTYIDPSYTEKLIESFVANYEAMDMPEETKNTMIDATVESIRDQNMLTTMLTGIPLYGLLNLITGMIGVKLFASREDDEF